MRAKTIWALTAALVMSGPSVWAAIYTGGPGTSYAMVAMTNVVLLSAKVTLSSVANQSFARGAVPVAISPITIADDPATAVIKSGTPIAVGIPAGSGMTWDETDLTATFGGSAAGKVGAISYAGSNTRLLIAVTADFNAGDTLTVSALGFKTYFDSGGSTRLELDYDNDGGMDAQDDKTITFLGVYTGGLGANYALGQMGKDKSLVPTGSIIMVR